MDQYEIRENEKQKCKKYKKLSRFPNYGQGLSDYKNNLESIESKLGDSVTYDIQLDNEGKRLFYSNWFGVHPIDKLNFLEDMNPHSFAILNLSKTNEKGSHWIGVHKSNRTFYIYDSFGRQLKDIAPSLINFLSKKKYKYKPVKCEDANIDMNCQKITETNCGQRVLSWMETTN